MFVWHFVDALFDSFRKGKANTPRITELAQVTGYEDLKAKV